MKFWEFIDKQDGDIKYSILMGLFIIAASLIGLFSWVIVKVINHVI